MVIANIIGWIATIFRASGMLAKKANIVKYLVSIGNFFWMVNGILTMNIPLIASNAICLIVLLWEIIISNEKVANLFGKFKNNS